VSGWHANVYSCAGGDYSISFDQARGGSKELPDELITDARAGTGLRDWHTLRSARHRRWRGSFSPARDG